ncbi:Tas retrotransposon peptidase A16 [Trichuris suis]|nr:Tas retrotransposon peptidase A16 [Trichuris suis]
MNPQPILKHALDNELTEPPAATKSRRAHYRRLITSCCKKIETILSEQGSRRVAMALLRRAQEALECSNKLNDELSYELKAEEAEGELDRQLNYVQKVEEIAEAVEVYRQSRGIDASSVVSQLEDDNDDHSVDSTDTAIHDSAITDADMYGASRGNVPNYEREETAHRLGQLQVRDMRMADAPDQWIDEYVTGRAIPNVGYDDSCRRSAVRAELDSYDGTESQWFAWIDLFKALVHDTAMSPGEKLAILRNSLKGDCRDLVYALGGGEDAYKEALRSLKARCGRRDVIRAAHLQALYKLDPGRTPSQMLRFAERVRTHLFDLSRTGETANTDIVDCLLAKLSIQDRLGWHEMCQRDSGPLSLPKFGHWLCSRAAAYQNAYELVAEQSSNITKEVPGKISRNQARSHTMTSQKDRDKWTCHCCTGSHSLSACMDFKKLKVSQRWQLVKKKKICFSCLQGQHRSTECQYSKLCGVNGCQSAHHPLLHRQHGPQQERNASVNSACSKPGQVALWVVTVYVIDSNGSKIPVNLFFDEGSDKTFVRGRLLNKLQLHDALTGRSLTTRGFGGVQRWFNSFLVKLTIERLDSRARFDILVNTAPVLCDPVPTICWPKIKHRWKHLADLPLAESKGRAGILLGLDHADLMSAIESRQGDKDEPVAMNTALGWVARGVIGTGHSQLKARTNLAVRDADEDLVHQFRQFCETEAFGTEGKSRQKLAPGDERAKQIVESGTRKLENELPMVLMKFSEEEVAFAADIEAMFSRIRLRPEDARYHRFLWKEDKTERTKVFQMNRVTFGDTCSPFLAISTIMRTAREFGQGKEEAVRAIKNNLYMDDYLDSAGTISEAIVRAREVRDILGKGDFHLTKWISNRAEVMEAFNEKPASPPSVEPYRLGEDTYDTKVLGVRWRPLDDVLVFHVDLGG